MSAESLEIVGRAEASKPVAGVRLLAALCVASFLAAVNFYAMTPFYAEIARDLGTTIPLLGQIATAMILISAVLGLLVGPLADRFGFRWPLVIGVLAVAVTLIGSGIATSYPMLFAISLTGGLADAFVFGLPLAVAGARFDGEARKRAIGWTLGSLSCAPIIGVPVLTTIGGWTSWRAALIAAGFGSAASALFVWSSLPADVRRPADRFNLAEVFAAYQPLVRDRHTLRALGANALRAVTWIGVVTYLGAYLANELDLGTRAIGFVYTATGLGAAAGSFTGGRLPFRTPQMAVAVSSMVSGTCAAAVLLLDDVRLVIPSLLVMMYSAAVAGIAIVTILAAESKAGTGTTMVLNGSVLNLGAAAGSALGGGLIAIGGYTLLGIVLPVFIIAAAPLVWRSN